MKKNLAELDVYSGISILFVLMIHAMGSYFVKGLNLHSTFEAFEHIRTGEKLLKNIVDLAVPMFIFIAGYKYSLSNKNNSYVEYAKKKLFKILPPFLMVSFFFILLAALKKMWLHESAIIVTVGLIKDTIKIFLGYNYAYQLWYIPLYFFIVLSYPLIEKVIQSNTKRMVIFGFVVFVLLHVRYVQDIVIKQPFDFLYFFYLFELGSILYTIREKITSFHYGCIGLICLGLLFIITFTDSFALYSYTRETLIPFGSVFFLFVSQRLKTNKLLLYLGKYSFWIFLFHEPLFMEYTGRVLIHFKLMDNFYSIFILAAIPAILSISLYKVFVILNRSIKRPSKISIKA